MKVTFTGLHLNIIIPIIITTDSQIWHLDVVVTIVAKAANFADSQQLSIELIVGKVNHSVQLSSQGIFIVGKLASFYDCFLSLNRMFRELIL